MNSFLWILFCWIFFWIYFYDTAYWELVNMCWQMIELLNKEICKTVDDNIWNCILGVVKRVRSYKDREAIIPHPVAEGVSAGDELADIGATDAGDDWAVFRGGAGVQRAGTDR